MVNPLAGEQRREGEEGGRKAALAMSKATHFLQKFDVLESKSLRRASEGKKVEKFGLLWVENGGLFEFRDWGELLRKVYRRKLWCCTQTGGDTC